MNIFPLEWRVETPKLQQIYDASRVPGWSPHTLPWDTLDPEAFSLDERYALAYWFTLLSVFDGSGPAVFSRAFIHTWETHEEDPIRKCFFSIVRDEVNHEEVCQRAIQTLTPNGPLDYEPETPLGQLARNNIKWYYHNGCRYWNGFKNGVTKFQLPILFSSFLMGEVASATLFHSMYQRTTIPAFKEAFKQVGKDEARHMAVCLAVLRNVLPHLTDEQRSVITKQIRAGFIFLSGILYVPPEAFWELGPTFHPAHRMLEVKAREAGLGILTEAERAENWREAVLRLKGVLEPHGVEFPALPEVGIDGKTVAFDPDDIIPVF
nr:diiron oxygenase [Candidatus Entotheonella palauensis]